MAKPTPLEVDFQHVRTARLDLDIATGADLSALYDLHRDPRSWAHNPGRRHTDPERAQQLIRSSQERFEMDGLSYWCVREHGRQPVIGWAGCSKPAGKPWWNLTYRIHPEHWGHGYAAQAAQAAIEAAHHVEPDRPVLAFLVEHNNASKKVAERCQLDLVIQGPDKSLPGANRLVYLDRAPTDAIIDAITENMFPEGEYVLSPR